MERRENDQKSKRNNVIANPSPSSALSSIVSNLLTSNHAKRVKIEKEKEESKNEFKNANKNQKEKKNEKEEELREKRKEEEGRRKKQEGAMWISINQKGEIISCENGKETIGYQENELIHRRFSFLFQSPYKEHFDTLITEFWEREKEFETILSRSTLVEIEHKEKKIISMNLILSKVNEGNEKILIATLDKHHSLLSILTVNSNGFILSSNSHIESLFGYHHNLLAQKPLSFILPWYLFPSSSTSSSSPNSSSASSSSSMEKKGEKGEGTTNSTNEGTEFSNVVGKHANGNYFWLSLQRTVIRVAHLELNNISLYNIESNVEAFFTLNKDEVITSCNSLIIQTLFGYKGEELVGHPLSDLISKKNLIIFKRSGEKKLEKERETEGKKEETIVDCIAHPVRTLFRHKDGSQAEIYLQAFPFQRQVLYSNHSSPILEPFHSIRIKRVPLGSLPNSRVEDYLLLETVGSGSSGKVKRAIHQITKEQVAIKIISKKKLSKVDIERAHRETEIMLRLHNQHIVRFHHVIETPSKLFLIMELVSGIDLMKFVLQHGGLSESQAKDIFVQLISALRYCHFMKVIHRDVKHKNIIIQSSHQIKLIDFGLSNWNEEGTLKSSYCGTPAFASPEMILGHKYEGKLVDVWSAGVVLYSMLTCKFPFSNVGELLSGKFEDPIGVSPQCCEILRMMLLVDPQSRATIQKVWEHSWCSDSISQMLNQNPRLAEQVSMIDLGITLSPPNPTPLSDSNNSSFFPFKQSQ